MKVQILLVMAFVIAMQVGGRISTVNYSGITTYSDGSDHQVIQPTRMPCDTVGSYTRNNPFARFVKGVCLSRGTGTS